MEPSITVRVDVLQESRWLPVVKTGGSAEQFRSLIMDLGNHVARARGDLCRARRKLGAALVQIKQQVSYGEWTSFLSSLEVNEKTLRNAIALVERLCDTTGEFNETKVNRAAAERPGILGPTKSVANLSLRKVEELAGVRTARMNQTHTEFGTTVPNSESVRNASRFGAASSAAANNSDLRADFDENDDGPNEPVDDYSHLDDLDEGDEASWKPGHQMTFEDLRAAAFADATRLCGLLQRPDADPALVQRFHDWAQRELV